MKNNKNQNKTMLCSAAVFFAIHPLGPSPKGIPQMFLPLLCS